MQENQRHYANRVFFRHAALNLPRELAKHVND